MGYIICMDENVVVCVPPLPFWHGIPGGLTPGKMVEVRGIVPYGADTFQVNFTEALDSPGNTADRALHLSVRMGQRIVVRNTMANGCWETEERSGGFPFQPGKQFIMLILADSSSYKIAVNGQHQWEFYHRFGLERARMLYIDGSVRIEEVRILSKQPPPVVPTVPQQRPVTVHNPVIPFIDAIPMDPRSGTTIEIQGFVPHNAEVFRVNLVESETDPLECVDRLLHISVRLPGRVVVLNTMRWGKWEEEERHDHFPFSTANHFRMKILIDRQCYRISVDGEHHSEFRHRFPVSRLKNLYIDGNVIIDRVIYVPPFLTNKLCKEVQPDVYLQEPVINPVVPYHHPFPGGLTSGFMIYISGEPKMNAGRFTINLRCADCKASTIYDDTAFHFDVRFFNRTVVRNTMVDGEWGKEERVSPYFPFAPGCKFDMIIHVQPDKYMVAVNGQHFAYYMHRITHLKMVNELHIDNDINVSYICFCMT